VTRRRHTRHKTQQNMCLTPQSAKTNANNVNKTAYEPNIVLCGIRFYPVCKKQTIFIH